MNSNRKARKIEGNDKRVYDVNQSRTLTVSLSFNDAFELCRERLLVLEDTVITKEDRKAGMLEAKRDKGFLGLGHRIEINLTKMSNALVKIELELRPSTKTIVLVEGEGWKIIEELSSFIVRNDKTNEEKNSR